MNVQWRGLVRGEREKAKRIQLLEIVGVLEDEQEQRTVCGQQDGLVWHERRQRKGREVSSERGARTEALVVGNERIFFAGRTPYASHSSPSRTVRSDRRIPVVRKVEHVMECVVAAVYA